MNKLEQTDEQRVSDPRSAEYEIDSNRLAARRGSDQPKEQPTAYEEKIEWHLVVGTDFWIRRISVLEMERYMEWLLGFSLNPPFHTRDIFFLAYRLKAPGDPCGGI